jgi:hypothetical protein
VSQAAKELLQNLGFQTQKKREDCLFDDPYTDTLVDENMGPEATLLYLQGLSMLENAAMNFKLAALKCSTT